MRRKKKSSADGDNQVICYFEEIPRLPRLIDIYHTSVKSLEFVFPHTEYLCETWHNFSIIMTKFNINKRSLIAFNYISLEVEQKIDQVVRTYIHHTHLHIYTFIRTYLPWVRWGTRTAPRELRDETPQDWRTSRSGRARRGRGKREGIAG